MNGKKGTIPMLLGCLLLILAFGLIGYNQFSDRRSADTTVAAADYLQTVLPVKTIEAIEEAYAAPQDPGIAPQEPQPVPPGEAMAPDYVLNPQMEMPTLSYEGQDYIGILLIPEIDLQLPIISQWSNAKLLVAPCRYYGSVYTDDMVIAGHNYRSQFRKLASLQPGVALWFVDVKGNLFSYQVALCETLLPGDVDEMNSGEWDLSLFTCTVGARQRITVRCERIDGILS